MLSPCTVNKLDLLVFLMFLELLPMLALVHHPHRCHCCCCQSQHHPHWHRCGLCCPSLYCCPPYWYGPCCPGLYCCPPKCYLLQVHNPHWPIKPLFNFSTTLTLQIELHRVTVAGTLDEVEVSSNCLVSQGTYHHDMPSLWVHLHWGPWG
jgi:hypothetical protein